MAWLGELVFDTLIFGMTLYKALTLPRVGGIGLLTVLMRDGVDGSFLLLLVPARTNCYHFSQAPYISGRSALKNFYELFWY